jgi:hypothetical protein
LRGFIPIPAGDLGHLSVGRLAYLRDYAEFDLLKKLRRAWAWIPWVPGKGITASPQVQLDGLLKDLISDQVGGCTMGEELI